MSFVSVRPMLHRGGLSFGSSACWSFRWLGGDVFYSCCPSPFGLASKPLVSSGKVSSTVGSDRGVLLTYLVSCWHQCGDPL